jgi:hypothetical protein
MSDPFCSDFRSEGTPDANLSASFHPQIQVYLDRVCLPLATHVSETRLEEVRQELQDHLETLAMLNMGNGIQPEKAIEEALARFGSPEDLAERLIHIHRATTLPPVALKDCLAVYGMYALLTLWYVQFSWWLWMDGFFLGFFILFGVFTGYIFPRRSVMTVFYSVSSLPLTIVFIAHIYGRIKFGSDYTSQAYISHQWLSMALVQFLLWLPLSCTAALVGGELWHRLHRGQSRSPDETALTVIRK